MINIIIVDDHKIFRQGLKTIITVEKFGNVIAEAGTGLEAIALFTKHTPDLVLMDIDMPEMNGIEATTEALKMKPDLKILCLTTHGDEAHYYAAIEAGARGFVLKTAPINELQLAISEVAAGGNYISSELLRNIVAKVNKGTSRTEVEIKSQDKLTTQEIDVLLKISKGYLNDEIATELNIDLQTIEACKTQLLAKTQSRNMASLIIYAVKNKIIVVD